MFFTDIGIVFVMLFVVWCQQERMLNRRIAAFKRGNFTPLPFPITLPLPILLPLPFQDTKHVCDLICGKKLQCGQHSCVELCHKGHCEKCWEYSEFLFD